MVSEFVKEYISVLKATEILCPKITPILETIRFFCKRDS